jgi:predicted negative regulator of RcsB-dependent stress response
MVTIKDIQTHLEKRSAVPRVHCGIVLVLILGIVCIFGYYVWNGVQEDVVSAAVRK